MATPGLVLLLLECLARLLRVQGVPLEAGPGLGAILRHQFERFRAVSWLTRGLPGVARCRGHGRGLNREHDQTDERPARPSPPSGTASSPPPSRRRAKAWPPPCRKSAARPHRHPDGREVRVALSTLWSWLAAHRQGGLLALQPTRRKDRATLRAFPEAILAYAVRLRRENPQRSTRTVIDIMVRDAGGGAGARWPAPPWTAISTGSAVPAGAGAPWPRPSSG